ncbi:MAG TPA: hypothetical protein VEX86_13995 [Longimicrobium sp.]|nr:hypothetical protein [Longimicrobium sp.]
MRHDSDHLASLWREHAALLRKYGAEKQAAVLEQCAAEVEAEREKREAARISLDDAVQLTGFSRSHLRRLWRTGKVRQLGTQENPEFHAADLPRKSGYVAENKTLAEDETQPVNLRMQVARAVVRGE